MSLRVWLPLNGDLHNQGLDDITVTNSGATVTTGGKIGKNCYQFDGDSYMYVDPSPNLNIKSACFWIYIANTGNFVGFCDYKSGLAFGVYSSNIVVASVAPSGQTVSATTYPKSILTLNTWLHIAVVRNEETPSVIDLYIDGEKQTAHSATDRWSSNITDKLSIGARSNGSTNLQGKINDFRLYDHALSAKEVKEISKALVLHYPLDDYYSSTNLLINGFGELGTTNWTNTSSVYIKTDDLPDDPKIKEAFMQNQTKEHIPIDTQHSYTISEWVKATGSGTFTYPSIFPYDIDNHLIYHFQCPDGFLTSSYTTLKQALKKGDTVIYANDLSGWSTATNNYYYHVAIFGYEDSTGRIYDDYTYTRNTPTFGTYADKSNINKTNNTITLLSAYTGEDCPAGTAICQSTEGSTYWYPFGGIKVANIADWTFVSRTFVPSQINRLKYATNIIYHAYPNALHAGIKIIDDTMQDGTVYDTSGYGHNGIANEITIDSDSPKYNVSSVFTSSNYSYIKVDDNTWMSQGATEYTINLWVNTATWTARLFSCTESGGFNTEGGGTSGYIRHPIHVYTNAAQTSAGYLYDASELAYSDYTTGWHMVTFVYTTSGKKTYVDAELKHEKVSTSYGVHFNENARLYLGCEASGANPSSPYLTGKESDFRLYYTALSADDIKELYDTGMSIDNKQNIHTYELDETYSTIGLKKTGVLNAKDIFTEDDSVGIYKSGLITANQFYER